MAPEIMIKAPNEQIAQYNEMVDIWSIGVLAYTLLTGEYPFDFE